MEKLLEDGINEIGLGPQGMGGKYSVMGVHIENTARHPSTIGVAVNVGCWSHRRGHIIFLIRTLTIQLQLIRGDFIMLEIKDGKKIF